MIENYQRPQTMRRITSFIVYPVLIVIILLLHSSFLAVGMAKAAEEYRHSVIDTLPVERRPTRIAVNPNLGFGYIYVAISLNDTVAVIDPSTHKLVKYIPVGQIPTGVAIRPNTPVFVANADSDTVSVIDVGTNQLIDTIPVGHSPGNVIFPWPNHPFYNFYVANAVSNTLSVINADNHTVVATIQVGSHPVGLAFSPHDKLIFVTNALSDDVSVVDPSTNKVVNSIRVGDYPYDVDVNPFNGLVYVANYYSNTISVISQFGVINTINVDSPIGIEFNPTNHYLYVANFGKATVSVIDPATNEIVDTISVGSYPYGVTFNPLNGFIYVSNAGSNTVSVISIEDPGACLTNNIQHWDKIIFMITSPDLAQRVHLPANTELDMKVLDDPKTVVDIKQKVLEFLKVPNEPKDTVQILNVGYDIICASLPIPQPDIDDEENSIIIKNLTKINS
jgi:YVTN family beta-propeller protein